LRWSSTGGEESTFRLVRNMRIMKFTKIALLLLVASLFAASCSSEGNVFALAVGDCFGGTVDGEVSDVPVVDCDEPHESQVFGLLDVPGDSLPIGTESYEQGCLDLFESAIGTPFDTSVVYLSMLYPTQASWDQGDREVVCYGFEIDDAGDPIKVTGTILNSGR
jgi:hypothetical protein